MVSAKCIRGGVGPVFEPVSNFFQESQQLLQRLDTLCKNGRLSRSGSRVRTIFEPFSNFFRTPISPEDLFEPVSNFFQESQQLLQRLDTLCKNGRLSRSGSRVRPIFEPFSNFFQTQLPRARAPSIQLRQSRPMPGCQSRPMPGSFAGYPFVSCGWGGGSNGRRAVPRGPGWPLRSV